MQNCQIVVAAACRTHDLSNPYSNFGQCPKFPSLPLPLWLALELALWRLSVATLATFVCGSDLFLLNCKKLAALVWWQISSPVYRATHNALRHQVANCANSRNAVQISLLFLALSPSLPRSLFTSVCPRLICVLKRRQTERQK